MLRDLILAIFIGIAYSVSIDFGYPAGVDVWCGKAYRAANESFEPGGWLNSPVPSQVPLLDVSIRPRMNLYTSGEDYASFIVDALISHMHGKLFTNTTFDKQTNTTSAFETLYIDIAVVESGINLVSHQNISVNSSSNEFVISLASFTPRLEPYMITLVGAAQDGAQSFIATTNLAYLPARKDGGSVVKIDSLYGGILVQDYLSNSTTWSSIFPYTYYVSWDGWLELSIDNLQVYKSLGYNIIHIVPNDGLANHAFNYTELEKFLDVLDELELWLMFDMRWTYTNLTSVTEQLDVVSARKSLLLYYTSDEPDGQVDNLNATKITYDLIKSIDPWHPISLCLNCRNFYFDEYSSGADIILSDPYPISVNTSWSSQYDTACNATYGCCGCDDCDGTFEDVSARLDIYTNYQDILGQPQKPKWGVPQAFGNETFWSRYPTPEEELVMNMLFVNHGAKGIAMWDYPTTPGINNLTSTLVKVLTSPGMTLFLLGSSVQAVTTLKVAGNATANSRIDVATWTVGNKVMVSVINLEYVDRNQEIKIALGGKVASVESVWWGKRWNVGRDGELVSEGMSGLGVDIFVVVVDGS